MALAWLDWGLGGTFCIAPFGLLLGGFLGILSGLVLEAAVACWRWFPGFRIYAPAQRPAGTSLLTRKELGASLGLAVLLGTLGYLQPWDPVGPWGYCRIGLGMTEEEIISIVGRPAWDDQCRHGGMLSSGPMAVPYLSTGIAFDDLPRRPIVKASDGQVATVNWWRGSNYLIEVAFDNKGKAIGIRLMKLRW
jgi:hypothetical protein